MQSLGSRLARGDEGAFAELYDLAADRLHRFLSARLRSEDAAADVLQAVFLRAVAKRGRFANIGDPLAYLFRIAVNEAARAGAKQRRKKPEVSLSHFPAADPGLSLEDAVVVIEAMSRLDAKDRELVELKVLGQLTFRELSEVLGMPMGTVATRYRRALESLRPWLTRQLSN